MIPICIVHNNERDRLAYLRPRLDRLVERLARSGFLSRVQYVGPEASGMADRVPGDTKVMRLRRARDMASAVVGNSDPRKPMNRRERMRRWVEVFTETLRQQNRSIKIEQEVYEAHKVCWRSCVKERDYTVILESDARFRANSPDLLAMLLQHVRTTYKPADIVYVDLAGGYDRREIVGSWNFDPAFGCRTFTLPNCAFVQFQQLRQWTGNTVGGYLVSPALAKLLLEESDSRRLLLPPDWAMNLFACHNSSLRNGICIHSTPTLFQQGSTAGAYASSIAGRMPARSS